MKRLMLLFLFGCWSICLGQSAPVAADVEALADLAKLREGMVQSFNEGNIDQLLTYLDPNVIVTWQNGEVSHGPAEVRAYYNRMMKGDHPVVKSCTANPVILGRQINGDWAVSWGNLHDHMILNDGRDLAFDSVFTITTAKRGDRWLVVGYHASINAFANPILNIAERKVGLWVGGVALAGGILLGLLAGKLCCRKKSANI